MWRCPTRDPRSRRLVSWTKPPCSPFAIRGEPCRMWHRPTRDPRLRRHGVCRLRRLSVTSWTSSSSGPPSSLGTLLAAPFSSCRSESQVRHRGPSRSRRVQWTAREGGCTLRARNIAPGRVADLGGKAARALHAPPSRAHERKRIQVTRSAPGRVGLERALSGPVSGGRATSRRDRGPTGLMGGVGGEN